MKLPVRTFPLLLSFSLISLGSCNSEHKEEQRTAKPNTVKKPRRGDVRDAHGCLTSEGYVWSEVKDSCVHLWEVGTELTATDRSEHVVIVVTSNNKTEAEIFVPEESSFILTGTGNGTYSNDSLVLTEAGKDLVLRKGGKAIYQTGPPEPVQPVKRTKQVAKQKRR